ncbi:sensor histidine kinase [Pedobacter rhodius]|uniref:histidine kinase n=1 Tax=Pedobacter rhodius TaxID=3004098 RepID=A0ABT4KVG9_9SPHI|nr:PAS domain-containing sensor histidine kinase [Pedobacter sp. SJ11]MCZ4222924.1 PAS domain-containing sensor histidine kinase [Pedobacter sp. SJ11]
MKGYYHEATSIANASPGLHNVTTCGITCKVPAVSPAQSSTLWQQIKNFSTHIFDTKDWPPRWYCGSWSDFHGWLYILSDVLIWASYFAIPVILIIMLRKRPDLPFPKIVWLFVGFIVLCGLTHLIDAIIFWWPAYRLSAVIRFLTALVSAITVYALYKIVPSVLSLRSVEELEREIESRKLVEEKLAANEFLLLEAGRLGKVGGWEFDIKSQKVSWSKVVYDIHGLPHDHNLELDGAYSYYTPPFKNSIKTAVEECLNNGTSYDLELQIQTAGGAVIWVRTCGEAFYDEEGNIAKLRGVLMDIDKYKINEVSLYKSIEMVNQNNKQLKGFTHILSHNIRNHASNFALLTSMIDTSELSNHNAEHMEKLRIVSGGLNKTLDDLKDAIKIRESIIAAEALSIAEITNNVVAIMQSEILESRATIEKDFAEQTILFPKLYLESIIMNLISNAIKYKKADEDLKISLKTYKNINGQIVLECQDNGLGIDLQLHGQKIFGLYKTFHNHKNAHGVGLFLVKTQVESQGGIISVESTEGNGATFRINFN